MNPVPTDVEGPELAIKADIIRFFVDGHPATAGSKKAFPLWAGTGPDKRFVRSIIVDSSGANGKTWRESVRAAALTEFTRGRPLLEGALALTLEFRALRPKWHFGARGLKATAPKYPAKKPDVLKLARAVEDALTGIVWRDDAQIVAETLRKSYAERPGVQVSIVQLT